MINVLFETATKSNLTKDTIEKIKIEKKVSKALVVVLNQEIENNLREVATCILREDLCKGEARPEQYIEKENIIEPDAKLLEYMNKYALEIIDQQRRFEHYWMFHISDRYEDHYDIYINNVRFWLNILIHFKVTHYYSSLVPHEAYNMVAYRLCDYLGIKKITFYNSTLLFRQYVVGNNEDHVSSIKSEYNRLLNIYNNVDVDNIVLPPEAQRPYDKWLSRERKTMTPFYAKGNPFANRFHMRFGQTNLLREWFTIMEKGYREGGMKKDFNFIIRELRDIPEYIKSIPRVYKRWKYARAYLKSSKKMNAYYGKLAGQPVEGEKYIYFALHYQPEASTNPLGGVYTDQLLAIKLLAQHIPDYIKIYVKSHPEQLAPFRSEHYYNEMSRIKNIKIISMDVNTFDLMKGAIAVATVTGTAAWECQFFNIPAILFGNSQKNAAPLSYAVRTHEDCEIAVEEIMKGIKKTTDKELKLFTYALYNTSFSNNDKEANLIKFAGDFFDE